MEREVGGGIGMGNTCKLMAVSFQCMTKFTTNRKINKKTKKNRTWRELHTKKDIMRNNTIKISLKLLQILELRKSIIQLSLLCLNNKRQAWKYFQGTRNYKLTIKIFKNETESLEIKNN